VVEGGARAHLLRHPRRRHRDLRGLPVGRRRGLRRQRPAAEIATLPSEWEDAGTFSNFTLRLTPDEAASLISELTTLIRGYRPHQGTTDAPGDARPVSVNLEVFLAPGMPTE